MWPEECRQYTTQCTPTALSTFRSRIGWQPPGHSRDVDIVDRLVRECYFLMSLSILRTSPSVMSIVTLIAAVAFAFALSADELQIDVIERVRARAETKYGTIFTTKFFFKTVFG